MMQVELFLSGEQVPPDIYRDILSGTEIALLDAAAALPPDTSGRRTCYVRLHPMLSASGRREITGACGRVLQRGGAHGGWQQLLGALPVRQPAPCTRCRRQCPGSVGTPGSSGRP